MIANCKIDKETTPLTYHRWPANAARPAGHPDRCLSRSELMLMLDSGEMFLAGGTRPASDSLRFGSLVDCMLLTPDLLKETCVMQPETYRSGGETKKWSPRAAHCKAWQKANPGKEPPEEYLTESLVKVWTNQSKTCREWNEEQEAKGLSVVSPKLWSQADECCHALRAKELPGDYPTVGDLIDACKSQVCITGEWHCPSTGRVVPLRALCDMVRDDAVIYDLKTSMEANRWDFERSIKKFHYDVQAWMYSAMLEDAVDRMVPFGFVVVRNAKPFLAATYRASDATVMQGKAKFEKAMHSYCEALGNGFQGYTRGFELI